MVTEGDAAAEPTCVAEAIAHSVAIAPGRFVFADAAGELKLDFATALSKAPAICGSLRAAGLGSGDVVVGLLEQSMDGVLALWAAALAGAIALPLSGGARRLLTPEGLNPLVRRLLETDPRAVLLVSDEAGATTARAQGFSRVLVLDHTAPEASFTPHRASPEETRLLILSSGTTGVANIVALSDRAVLNRWWPRLPAKEAAACHLSWSPIEHVMGVGAASPATPFRVLLKTEAFVEQPLRWLELIGRHGVTHCTMTNFGMKLILEALSSGRVDRFNLASIRRIGVGAEAVSASVAEAFVAALVPFGLDPDSVLQGYGLTECGPVISGPIRGNGSGLVSLSPGHEVRLVSDDGGVVGSGETGEIEVRGPSMASGYFGDGPETERLIKPDGWLRTGDLGAFADGRLTIVGRLKEIVVVNARKFPCREIEQAAERSAGVREAFAAPLQLAEGAVKRGRASFALFLVLEPGIPAESVVAQLRSIISRRFGAAPHLIIPIDQASVPRTSIGKTRRSALGEWASEGRFAVAAAELERRVVQIRRATKRRPASEIELSLAGIFGELLGSDDLGLDDDFFEFGGDSLASVRLLAEIEQQVGVTLPPETFDGPATIARLARMIEKQSADAEEQTAAGRTALEIQVQHPSEMGEAPYSEITPSGSGDGLVRQPDALPFNVLRALLRRAEAWSGDRLSLEGLMFGHNVMGKRPPLFWCLQSHPQLALMKRLLGSNQPLYAMRSGYGAMAYTPGNVTALAKLHVADILRVDPDGPYWIGGYCQGAYIAAAVARMLQAQGKSVALLSTADANPADVFADAPYDGRVAAYFGAVSEFNIFGRYRRPEIGLRKIFSTSIKLATLPSDHSGLMRRPVARTLVKAMKADAAKAFRAPAPTPARADQPWPRPKRAAQLSIINAPKRAKAGQAFTITVSVENPGATEWRPTVESGFALANHWLRENGELKVWSDGWTKLVEPLPAGASVKLKLALRAPAEPGMYWIEVDMVEEGVCWFKDDRSPTAFASIRVAKPVVRRERSRFFGWFHKLRRTA
jgi:acyl-CoA synthetase (AMP-forming)/AMP-acid ligase II/acyl carrier protein